MIQVLHVGAYTGLALYLLTGGGNWLCQLLLALTGLKDANAANQATNLRVGRVIGWLERLVLAAGLLAHSWEVMAAVVALKTVARFKELDEKIQAVPRTVVSA